MKKLVGFLAVLVASGALAMSASAITTASATPPPPGPENCEEGYFCTWTGGSFNGERTSWTCGGNGDNGGWTYSSVKNRCVNRKVTIGYLGTQGCVNPGYNRENVTSSVWNPGALGSRC